MLTTILIAQLAGPVCGYNYGVEITPADSPYVGCVVPDFYGTPAVRLRENPLLPGGIQAEPIRSEQ